MADREDEEPDSNENGRSNDADSEGGRPSDADPEGDEPSDADPKASGPGGRSQTNGGLPRLDRYFDALADRRRRYALYYLRRHGSASVEELARHVAARETGRPAADLSAEEYEHVQSSLYHNHLSRLADYGLAEFDPRTEMVRFGEPPRTFATLLWLSELAEDERES